MSKETQITSDDTLAMKLNFENPKPLLPNITVIVVIFLLSVRVFRHQMFESLFRTIGRLIDGCPSGLLVVFAPLWPRRHRALPANSH